MTDTLAELIARLDHIMAVRNRLNELERRITALEKARLPILRPEAERQATTDSIDVQP
jgi:hypothetical protein